MSPMRPADPVLAALAANGLILTQDKALPNVVGILTGEFLRTSWWSHPKAHLIFSVLSELAEHPDVLFTKLLSRKDTLVHRSLWPAVLAVGSAREPWQVQGLSDDAKRLLERLDRDGSVHAAGAPVRELEARLLARAQEVHTESGRHEKALESWHAWSARVGCSAIQSVPRACEVLEEAAVTLGSTLRSLPWPAKSAAT
jgi:xanthosine utilization system XapX-like protein